tara:strand:- start:26 stop:220 length:195 start_codon:yes stop_codon:yes gene_type:complete
MKKSKLPISISLSSVVVEKSNYESLLLSGSFKLEVSKDYSQSSENIIVNKDIPRLIDKLVLSHD